MPLERFEDQRKANKYLHGSTHEAVKKANIIIALYQARGYTLTLRQIFYQFVRRNWIENSERAYKNLGKQLSAGRLFGLIDWDAIEDRTRFLREFDGSFENSHDFMQTVPYYYAEKIWVDQPYYIEVLLEKDAAVNIIQRPCSRWHVAFAACRGYNSQSEMYRSGQRIEAAHNGGKKVVIMHIGDHDPSGQDMTRDNEDRLQMFSHYAPFEFRRLALNMDQIKKYKPPPQNAKDTDSRTPGYVASFGRHCYELDALEPEVLDALVSDEIESLVDKELFAAAIAREEKHRDEVRQVAKNWEMALDAIVTNRTTDNGDYAW